MDVGSWLKSIGLGELEKAFKDNAIDFGLLHTLTNEDLIEMGIAQLGKRKKILAAIKKLTAEDSESEGGGGLAQRRQITVMFCDLVDSTKLAQAVDPEELFLIIKEYQNACLTSVKSFDGYVAKYMGDGVMVYFGYPRAHEDDAERAIHCGLAIVDVIKKMRPELSLSVRIGIATGMVVVGEMQGQGSSREQPIVGTAPNLASRLQSLAKPGTIRICSTTQRLVDTRFNVKSMGPTFLKGFDSPEMVWSVEGHQSSSRRFGANYHSLVGRTKERSSLLKYLEFSWQSKGQVVFVQGEAGIGKSRLTAWLEEQVADRPHTTLIYQCSPYHTGSMLHPFAAQLAYAAGIDLKESSEQKMAKLNRLIEEKAPTMKGSTPLFAWLLGILPEGDGAVLSKDPVKLRKSILSAFLQIGVLLAKKQPMLLFFEDVHWIDPTSMELVSNIIDEVRELPVLMVVSSRPEFSPNWLDRENVRRLPLSRLDNQAVEEVIVSITGGKALPSEVVQQIVSKADGVPLFVEELTKMVMASRLLVEDGNGYHVRHGSTVTITIPTTLQNSLIARLDQNPNAWLVAQAASAIGREFSYELITELVSLEPDLLDQGLEHLEEANVIRRQQKSALRKATFAFSHALLQEAAYDSILKAQRNHLHSRIAEILHATPSIASTKPDLLAHHYSRADAPIAAFEWWGKAGDRSTKQGAYAEAAAHLRRALEIPLAATGENDMARLRLQLALGNALMATDGYGAASTTEAFGRARDMSLSIKTDERFGAMYGLWASGYVRGDLPGMVQISEDFVKQTEQRPGTALAIAGHRCMGGTLWFQGEFGGAKSEFEKAMESFSDKITNEEYLAFGHDLRLGTLCSHVLALWPLGLHADAHKFAEKSITLADSITQLWSRLYTHIHLAIFYMMIGDDDNCRRFCEPSLRLSKENGLALFVALCNMIDAILQWKKTKAKNLAPLHDALKALRGGSVYIFMPIFASEIVRAEMEEGSVEKALALTDEILADNGKNGQQMYDSVLLWRRGLCLLDLDASHPQAAEQAFKQAMETARRQQARAFELQTAFELVKIWHPQGKTNEAIELLKPICDSIRAHADSQVIGEADRVIASLTKKTSTAK